MQVNAVNHAKPTQAVIGNAEVRRPANNAVNFIALVQQQPGKIGAVLTRNTWDQCASRRL